MNRPSRTIVVVLIAALVVGLVPLPPSVGSATPDLGAATPIPNYLSCVVSIALGGADPNFSAAGFPRSCVFAVFDLLKALFGGTPEQRSVFTCYLPDESAAWQMTIGWHDSAEMKQRFDSAYNLCKGTRQGWIDRHPEFFGVVKPPVFYLPPDPPPRKTPIDPCIDPGCIYNNNPNATLTDVHDRLGDLILAYGGLFGTPGGGVFGGGLATQAWWQVASARPSALGTANGGFRKSSRGGSALGMPTGSPRDLPGNLLESTINPGRILPGRTPAARWFQEGRNFQAAVNEALGFSRGNTRTFDATTIAGEPIRTIPDLTARRTGVVEIKDARDVTFTKQLQGEFNVAEQQQVPFSVVISPKTVTVSRGVREAIQATGGVLLEYNPMTRSFRTVRLKGRWVQR